MKRTSKYVNQIKRVNEIVFSSVEYKKGKLKVVAEGYTGEIWIGTQTWKNYDDNSTTTKRSSLHSDSKRFKETFTKIVEVIKETKQTFALIPIGKVLTIEDIMCYQQRKKIKDAIKKVESDTIDDVLRKLHKFEHNKEKFESYLIDIFMRDSLISEQKLRRTYKTVAREFHPDIFKHKNANELMVIINDMYEAFSFERIA